MHSNPFLAEEAKTIAESIVYNLRQGFTPPALQCVSISAANPNLALYRRLLMYRDFMSTADVIRDESFASSEWLEVLGLPLTAPASSLKLSQCPLKGPTVSLFPLDHPQHNYFKGMHASIAFATLANRIRQAGITVELESTGFYNGLGNALAWAARNEIHIKDSEPSERRVQLLLHELVHVVLEHGEEEQYYQKSRKEFEAQAASYLLLSHLCLPTTMTHEYLARSCRSIDVVQFVLSLAQIDAAIEKSLKIILPAFRPGTPDSDGDDEPDF